MNHRETHQLASPKSRAAARAIDAVVTAALALVMAFVAGCSALFLSWNSQDYLGDDTTGDFNAWMIALSLLGLIPVACYEIVSTARRGQTFGKSCLGIGVVLWDDQTTAPACGLECPDARRSIERWTVPHGSGLIAGVVAGAIAARGIDYYGVFVGAGAWLVVSTVFYLSSLLDKNGRGWHDKAAGTIVVEASCLPQTPARQDPQPQQSDSPGPARPVPEDS